MSQTIARLEARHDELRQRAVGICETAIAENRDLSTDEARAYEEAVHELEQVAERLKAIEAGEQRARDIEESFARLKAKPVEVGDAATSASDGKRFADNMRDMLISRNPRPLTMPYLAAPSAAFLMRPSTLAALKNIKAATTGQPIGIDFVAQSPWPYFVDSNVANFGNGNAVWRSSVTGPGTSSGSPAVVCASRPRRTGPSTRIS